MSKNKLVKYENNYYNINKVVKLVYLANELSYNITFADGSILKANKSSEIVNTILNHLGVYGNN